jgi:hypothetical protein
MIPPSAKSVVGVTFGAPNSGDVRKRAFRSRCCTHSKSPDRGVRDNPDKSVPLRADAGRFHTLPKRYPARVPSHTCTSRSAFARDSSRPSAISFCGGYSAARTQYPDATLLRYNTSRYSPGLLFVSRARLVLLFIATLVRLSIDLLS